MFTGLVETMGRVASIHTLDATTTIRIEAPEIFDDASIGDSICVNGCCLTIVAIEGDQAEFEAGSETRSRTSLGTLAVDDRVNLERSLRADTRMGGHYVTGHVDCLGTLVDRREEPPWAHLRFSMPPALATQVASKGSIAIDGISLTVVDVDDDSFTVALIPHTLDVTTLGQRDVGDAVNLETDLLAKYVQRAIATGVASLPPVTGAPPS